MKPAPFKYIAAATLEQALTSGEEAELLCAGPAELVERAGLASIGVLAPGGISWTDRSGVLTDGAALNWPP